MMGKYTKKHRWGVLLTFVFAVITQLVQAQSGSTGSTFVHTGGEMGIFGQHDFQNGSGTINAGIIGSERQPAIGVYGFANSAGSWINASDLAFVDGYVRTYNSNAFTFPIGDNNKYRPAAVSASSSAAPTTAAYYGVDPGLATTSDLKGGNYGILPGGSAFPTTSKDAGVGTVDNIEYWDIDGTTSARITLTWDAATPISAMVGSDLSKLKIVGWDGTKWVVIPSTFDAGSLVQNTSASAFTGPAGTVSAGSITTDASVVPGSFIVYTLAGTSCDLIATATPVSVTSCVSANSGAITITYAGTGSYEYILNNQPAQPLSATTVTINNLVAGSYTIVVQAVGDPTCIQSFTTTVSSPAQLTLTASSNSPICSGDNLQLQASLNPNSFDNTYSWTGPGGFVSTAQNPLILSGATGGTYNVTVTTPGGCSTSGSTNVVVTNGPSLTLATASLTICSGQSGTIAVGGDNGATVNWQSSWGHSGTGTTINLGTLVNNGSVPYTIPVSISAAAGSCVDTETAYITVKPAPLVFVVPSNVVVCNLENITLSASSPFPGATINWTRTPNSPDPPASSGTISGITPITQVLSPGTYTYTFTGTIDGCTGPQVSVQAGVNN